MANEAIEIEGPYETHDFTVAAGTGIEKGTILKLTDPRTASATSASGDVVAGIARTEKVANDGSTNLGVYTKGIFDLTVTSGQTVTAGELVSIGGANTIKTATEAEIAEGKAIGKALEDGSSEEVIEVAVNTLK